MGIPFACQDGHLFTSAVSAAFHQRSRSRLPRPRKRCAETNVCPPGSSEAAQGINHLFSIEIWRFKHPCSHEAVMDGGTLPIPRHHDFLGSLKDQSAELSHHLVPI
jgi:hypothetical protein